MPKTATVGQRFKIDDRVVRNHTIGYSGAKYKKHIGTIVETLTRANKLGVNQYYYKVLWDDKRSSEHAQHSLKPVE